MDKEYLSAGLPVPENTDVKIQVVWEENP